MTGLENIEARKDRAKLIAEAGAILDKAKQEKRQLTADETKRFDKMHEEAEGLLAQAERLEKQSRIELGLVERHLHTRDENRNETRRLFAVTANGERVPLLRPEERMADVFPADDVDLGDLVRGQVTGKWRTAEARDLAGAGTTGGGFLLSPSVSARVIDLARAKAQLIRAGAMTVPMDTGEMKVARVSADPTVQWRAENQPITASDLTFQGVVLKARTAGVISKVSVELIEDAVNLQTIIESTFASAIAVELDRVGLVGIGSAEEPLGLENTPGVGTAGSIGSPLYDDFIDAQATVRAANGEPTAAILNPRDIATLAKLKGTSNDHYLEPPSALSSIAFLNTTLVPKNRGGGGAESLGFVGDFSNMWFGIRTQLRIEASRSAGDSMGSAFGNAQVWLRAYIRVDVACVRPAHFVVMSGITT